ncbi:MAG: PTS sugar transporter subunit IIA [Rhodocyclaceae bacterium]|jgi:nitrogen PTS system EIIA component
MANMIQSRLDVQDILCDVTADSKDGLLDAVGRHMEKRHGLPNRAVVHALGHRERIGSTALGLGFAIPHARIQELEQIRIAYLRLKAPLAFEARDGKPVSDVLVVLVPKHASEEHLHILADATHMFSDPRFRERLQRCSDATAVWQEFAAWPHPSRNFDKGSSRLHVSTEVPIRPRFFRRIWTSSSIR